MKTPFKIITGMALCGLFVCAAMIDAPNKFILPAFFSCVGWLGLVAWANYDVR